jgi:adenylate cyclase
VMPVGSRLAVDFLERALVLEPNYAAAHALLGWSHEICYFKEPGLPETARSAGLRHAREAIANAADDATALAISALVIAHLSHEYAEAARIIERALSLNASCAAAFYFGAHIHAYAGEAKVAATYAQRALRLSPFDPLAFEAHQAFGMGAIEASRYDEAAIHFADAVQSNPLFATLHFCHAIALALAGREGQARKIAERGLELQPEVEIRAIYAIGFKPELEEKLARGARLLGLPE